MPLLIVILEVLGCLGFGALTLRACGVLSRLSPFERLTWSFAIGFGVTGWLVFFLGWSGCLSQWPLGGLLVIGCACLAALLSGPKPLQWPALTRLDWLGIALIAVVFLFDLTEALSPPADADSLAYHFATPKRLLQIGALDFVPRAVDGAAPLLVQMTYVPALGLGGEKALMLWTMLSGWGAGALIFTTARRFVSRGWAMLIALLVLTTPAVIYGGGTGQVEVRATLFVLVAALCVAEAAKTSLARYALIAGLMAGFYAGTKYLGLLFVVSAGVVLLLSAFSSGRAVRHAAVFSVGAILAGFQWYFWNWLHSGDPIFPFLVGRLGIGDVSLWPADYQKWFESGFFDVERAVPSSVWWLFAYPVKATFAGAPEFESARTGLGPFLALVAPLALLGAYQVRQRLLTSPLVILMAIGILFYVLWFLTGSSQRIRHLVPIYALIVIPMATAAVRYSSEHGLKTLLSTIVGVTLVIQLAGHAVYSANYTRYVLGAETREAFLHRNITAFDLVDWVNRNLDQADQLFTTQRQLIYFLAVPVLYGHQYLDARVDLRAEAAPDRLLAQLRKQAVTHVMLAHGMAGAERVLSPVDLIWEPLKKAACMTLLYSGEFTNITSRALAVRDGRFVAEIYVLRESCRL